MRRMVLIHGAGGGAWQWRDWLPVLNRLKAEVVALELKPNPTSLAATRLEDYLAQVLAVLEQDEGPTALIGASLGGLLALLAAAERPVSALALVNPVPPRGVPGWPPPARSFDPSAAHPPRPQGHARNKGRAGRVFPDVQAWSTLVRDQTAAALADGSEDAIDYAHARWRDESGAVLNAAWAGVPAGPILAPALVLAGRLDATVPPTVSQALAERLGADFVSLARTGHLGALLGRRARYGALLTACWLRGQAAFADA